MPAPFRVCLLATSLFLPLFVLPVLALASCRASPLGEPVESKDGLVRGHAPREPGWRCAPHDVKTESYEHAGIKCLHEAGVVLTAKVYALDIGDVRTPELFCMQDWKAAYAKIFDTVVSQTAKVEPLRGTPACKVTLEGMSAKGPWRLEELHAPNGRKLLQVSVNASLPVLREKRAVVDAWLEDLTWDLTLPGQVGG